MPYRTTSSKMPSPLLPIINRGATTRHAVTYSASSARQLGILLALVCSLLLPCPALAINSQQTPQKSWQYYESAVDLYHQGRPEAALIELKNSLQLNPHNVSALILSGEINQQLGNFPAAEVDFIRSLQRQSDTNYVLPKLGEVYLRQWKYKTLLKHLSLPNQPTKLTGQIAVLRGRAQLELGQLDEAFNSFTQAAKIAPQQADAWLGQAEVHMRHGDQASAKRLLKKSLSLDPESSAGLHLQAEFLRVAGLPEQAIVYYDQAVGFSPERVQTRISRVVTLLLLERDSDALDDIEFLLEKAPYHPHVNYLHARLLKRSGDPGAAQLAMNKVSATISSVTPEVIKNNPPSLLLFGLVSFEQQHLEQAYHYLSRFHQLSPAHQEGRKLFARTLVALGQTTQAITLLEPLIARDSQDLELFVMLGDILTQSRRHNEAQQAYQRALKLAPGTGALYRRLAESHDLAGRNDQALALLTRNYLADTNDIGNALLLGGLLIKEGDLELATRLAKRLQTMLPDNPLPVNLLGIALQNKGDIGGAKASFNAALALDASYITAHLNLAELAEQEDQPQTAQHHYHTIISQDPHNPLALVNLAKSLSSQDKTGQAIAQLEMLEPANHQALEGMLWLLELYIDQRRLSSLQALLPRLEKHYPGNTDIQLASSQLALLRHDRQLALEILQLTQDRANPRQLVEIARLYLHMGQTSAAQTSLEQATTQQPSYLPAQIALVQLDIRLGALGSAQARALALIQSTPQQSVGHTLLGDVLMTQQQYPQAAQAYRQALQTTAKAPIVVKWFEAERRSSSLEQALSTLQHWSSAFAQHPAITRLLAFGYLQTGQPQAALEAHEQLLTLNPDDPRVLNNLAWLCQQLGDKRALAFAQRAYNITPDNAASLDTLGWLLVEQGEFKQGLGLLREAHVRAAAQPSIRYHLAKALQQLDRPAEARNHLLQALASSAPFDERQQANDLLLQLSDAREKIDD